MLMEMAKSTNMYVVGGSVPGCPAPSAMEKAEILRRAHRFCAPFRIDDGAGFRLDACDPANTLGLDPSDKDAAAAVLRPLGPNGGIEGHVHAAVYRFRPLKHGQLDLAETLRPLFEHAPADTVMHLLGDDRDEGRAPAESRFMRGVCWVSPIRSIPATNSGRSAGQQETAA